MNRTPCVAYTKRLESPHTAVLDMYEGKYNKLHNKLNSTRQLLEDKGVNDVTVYFFTSLLYKTSRFHVVLGLLSNRTQKTSKYGKNISDTLA